MVQVIPKTEKAKESIARKMLPWFSFFLIIIVVFLYFVFGHQVDKTKVSLEEANKKLSSAQTAQQEELKNRIETLKIKIEDIIKLLQRRKKASNFFEFLENFTHPNVYFTSLSLSLDKGEAKIEGVSSDFTSLGQQIFAFEKDPFVRKVDLSSVGLSKEGLIKFSINIFLSQKEKDKKGS